MESFSGGMNPNIGKKFITLEDGSSVEAPEGVRDLQDYKEYLAEQEARAGEAEKAKQKEALSAEARRLASKIENSVDEEVVKHCLASGDFSKIFNALAGVDGVPMKGDQMRIDQDGRKLGETHDKYDAVMAEAMEILRNEYFGERVIEASEKSDDGSEERILSDDERYDAFQDSLKGEYEAKFDENGKRVRFDKDGNRIEESGEGEKSPGEMRDELLSEEAAKWLIEQGKTQLKDVGRLSDEELKGLYDEWLEHKDASKEKEEGEKSREEMRNELLSEEAAKWLVEQGKIQLKDVGRLSDEELKELYAQWIEYKSKKAEEKDGEKKEEEDETEKKPLIAVNIDRTRDAEAAARDIAERMLKEDLASGKGLGKFIKGIWKGNMFRGYYVEKNKRLAYERILDKQSGKGDEVAEHEWQSRSQATIDRFISEYDDVIHKDAGEWRNALPDGHPAAVEAKKIIADFATGNMDEAGFKEAMARVKAELRDDKGNPKGEVVLDNYLEIARAAKGRFDHEEGIESIMEGFKLISGEARANVRTEAHLKALDKLMNRYEHSKVGKFFPPELVAGVASVAVWLTLAGTKSAVKAATFGFGGAAVTGAVAGIKERSRVSVDRAQMARERASGLEVGGKKYDAKIMGTLYELAPAGRMTGDLRAALESGDTDTIMQKLTNAEVRTILSDGKKVDLIGYSDPTKIEDERFALDLARAEAKAKLRELGKLDEFAVGMEAVKASDEKEMDAKDAAFRKLRTKQMWKQGVKTAAIAAGTMILTQEVVAAFSPDSYGLADKAFGLENNPDAHNTMLAGMLGFKGPDNIILGSERIDAREASGVKLTDEEVAQLKEQGYTVNKVETTTLQGRDVELGAKEYAEQYGVRVSRDDWAANGTKISDGNELSAHYTANGDGIVTRMSGSSTTWGGESINFQDAVENGKIKAFISLTGDSQSTPIEVAGRMVSNGSQLEFIPDPGSAAAECFQDGKFIGKYFEIAFDNGMGADGVQHMIPLATVVGKGMEGAAFAATEQIPVTDVAYNVLGFDRITEAIQVAGDRMVNPAALLPFVRRDNLTAARRREQPAEQTPPTPPAPPTTPPERGGEGDEGSPSRVGNEELPADETQQSENRTGEGEQQEAEAPKEPEAPAPAESPDEGGENPTETTGEPTEEQPVGAGPEAQAAEQGDYDAEGEPIWENLADRVGGQRGVWIIEGGMDTAPEDWRNLEYQRWWDGLSDEVKDRFAGRGGDRLSPESETLFDWLNSTGKMASAEEMYGDDAEVYESTWNGMNDQQKEDIREGRFIPNNQNFVNWLRENEIIPAEGERTEPLAEAA